MAYNFTNVTDANSMYGVFNGLNSLLSGWLATMILAILFIVIFIIFKDKYDTKVILLVNSFVTTLVAGLFWTAGFISLQIVLIPVSLIAISVFIHFLE